MTAEPKMVQLDEFQQLAFTKAIQDRAEAGRAAQNTELRLRRLVSKIMTANGLTEKEWPQVGFERLPMGILSFDPAPTVPAAPAAADAEHANGADPTQASAGPHLVPPAPPAPLEVEWKERPEDEETTPPAQGNEIRSS